MTKERTGSKLQLALGNLDSLPAMPAIAQKLLALPLDTDQGEAQMLSLIEQDPQLSARIVGLANSPTLGVGRKITAIRDAAMLLGLKRLKSVAVGIATMSKLTTQPAAKNFDPQDLWSHSMTVAIVMNTLAREMPRRIRPDENQIFLAGLLHDIGLMVLHHLDFRASDELHRQLRLQPKRHIHDLELELLGVTHCQIGALLARHWHLPSEITEVVELHHSPRSGDVSLANPLVALVSVAEKLLPDFGIAEHTGEAISEDEWRDLCIDPARADEISALVNELAMQVVQLPETHQVSAPALKITKEQVVAPRRQAAQQRALAGEARSPMRALLRWLGGLWR